MNEINKKFVRKYSVPDDSFFAAKLKGLTEKALAVADEQKKRDKQEVKEMVKRLHRELRTEV